MRLSYEFSSFVVGCLNSIVILASLSSLQGFCLVQIGVRINPVGFRV